MIESPHEARMEIAAERTDLNGRVSSRNGMTSEHAVGPIHEGMILRRMAIAECGVVETFSGDWVRAGEVQDPELLISEGSFRFNARIERADRGRVEDLVGAGCRHVGTQERRTLRE